MLKTILELEGIKPIEKSEQRNIYAGNMRSCVDNPKCYSSRQCGSTGGCTNSNGRCNCY